MESFENYLLKNPNLKLKTWLVIGKGPSFSAERVNSSDFVKIGINHVYRAVQVDFLHVFDLDVLDSLDIDAFDQFKYLVLPWIPNTTHKILGLRGTFHRASKEDLGKLVDVHPVLRAVDAQQKLLFYFPDSQQLFDGVRVKVGSFSASTVVSLLGGHGIKNIRLNGIDGGRTYAESFADLQSLTMLDAGQDNFDLQFSEIANARSKFGLEVLQFLDPVPIRVFVGAQPEQELAYQVLKYSIEKHASLSVEVFNLATEIKREYPGYSEIVANIRQGTPFSLQRFAIPELCRFNGRAIYLDSDMLVFHDIRELWLASMDDLALVGADVLTNWGRSPQLSVLLFDCRKIQFSFLGLANELREGKLTYEAIFDHAEGLGAFSRVLSPHWNSLEHYQDRITRLLHYTNMSQQPWLSTHNPLAILWCNVLREAIANNAIQPQLVSEHVERGWGRPSLDWQVRSGVVDPYLIPKKILKKDLGFIPPHAIPRSHMFRHVNGFDAIAPSALQVISRGVYARARHAVVNSLIHSYIRRLRRVISKIRRAISTGIG